jgi:hypothetical protein
MESCKKVLMAMAYQTSLKSAGQSILLYDASNIKMDGV